MLRTLHLYITIVKSQYLLHELHELKWIEPENIYERLS